MTALPLLRYLPEPVEALTLPTLLAWADAHPAGPLRVAAEEIVFAWWQQKLAGHRTVPANAAKAWADVQSELLEGY
ncbi:hypothetical protein [Pseudactinotalea terrae]|uniref:hypothetical protein n=1 Tax=Pseudactinotalea terrae TaxID=1743262 RepID=UPI0012E2AEDC|nr:hypothetical protein [Pseudactinotalea terrae]